jgi:hypothetical protein
MNAPFKTVSGAICFIAHHVGRMPFRRPPLPGTEPMLIVLIALAVAFSLIAETIYGYFRDRDEAGWVRPELSEHAVIVRRLGGMRWHRPLESERQMNALFKAASDRHW